jgi:hypothetical protein
MGKQSYSDVAEGQKEHIFQDPALQSRAEDQDPLVKFLKSQWRFLVILVIAYFAAVYGQRLYRQTNVLKEAKRAESLGKMKVLFADMVVAHEKQSQLTKRTKDGKSEPKSGEELESDQKLFRDARGRFDEQLRIVKDQGEEYVAIAQLYDGVARARTEDYGEAAVRLGALGDWEVLRPELPERMLRELGAYTRGRALLQEDRTRNDGKDLLMKVARSAIYYNAAAGLALAATAISTEDKTSVVSLLKSIRDAHPEQTDLINGECRKLGLQLE